jgi:CBS domain containing-hemolysin-like protein
MASYLLPVIEDTMKLDLYIGTCQIGITISSLILGAYGQSTIAIYIASLLEKQMEWNNLAALSISSLGVLISLTVMQIVLGELVPKSIALQYPTQVSLITVIPMKWSLAVFSPFINILNGSSWAFLRFIGRSQVGHRHIHSPEEIKLLFAESRDGGLLEPDEHKRLHQALQLSIRPARQLMIPRIHINAIDIETPVNEVLEIVFKSPYTRLPVYRDTIDNITGILHTKDLMKHYLKNGNIKSIEKIIKPVFFIPSTAKADKILTMLREKHTHQAVLMDEFGGVEGLLTLEDLLTELVGEVSDEFKEEPLKPEKLPDGRIRLPGFLRLDEVVEWTGVLWQGDVDTLGGYVTECLGHMPVAGEKLLIQGLEVEIEEIEHKAISSILVKPELKQGEE